MKFLVIVFKNAWFVIKNFFGWMLRFAKHPEKRPIELRYKKLRNLLFELGQRLNMKIYVTGLENVDPNEQYLFTPNHQSVFDPLIQIMILEQPLSFISKYEVKKMPFVCQAVQIIDGEFMKRDDLRQSLKVIKIVTKDLEEGNKSWTVFPEGTRSRLENFDIDEFKYGTFKLAINSKKPIIPVALSGTWRIFDNRVKMKYYPIQFSFLKPITYEEYKDMTSIELAKHVEALVKEEHKRLRNLEPKLIKELNPKIKKIM